jgi:uncharacterized OB-fold protein
VSAPAPAAGEPVRLPPAELVSLTPDVFTEPFWRAAAEHRLVVPRCTSCATFRLPPSAFCWKCRAQEVEWVEQPGTGTVYSFTVIRHPLMPDLADTVPHVPAVVELPGTDGCRLIGPMTECDVSDVRIGLAVELVWRDIEEGVTVPTWRPA